MAAPARLRDHPEVISVNVGWKPDVRRGGEAIAYEAWQTSWPRSESYPSLC